MKRLLSVAAVCLLAAAWNAPAWAQATMLQERQAKFNEQPPASAEGAKIWAERCTSCHDNPVDRIPPRLHLASFRSPEQVVLALTEGPMRPQAEGLTDAQIREVATFLIGRAPVATARFDPNANMCKTPAAPMKLRPTDWASWGVDASNMRYQRKPGIAASDVPKLKVKWVYALPGINADGQPIVAGGRLFLTSRAGWVISLDAKTGCTRWTFRPIGGSRTGVAIGPMPAGAPEAKGAKFAAYFTTESGNLHALNAETGELLWITRTGDHPVIRISASPILHDGRIYQGVSTQEELATRDAKYVCCTSRGELFSVDAVTGKVVWVGYTIEEPKAIGTSTAGTQQFGPAGGTIWMPPTVDAKRGVIYAATGNSFTQVSTEGANAIAAFDLKTGERKWVTQGLADDNWCSDVKEKCPKQGPDMDMQGAPMLVSQPGGKQVLLAGVKDGHAMAVDPDKDGKLLWHKTTMKMGNSWGYAADEKQYYFNGSEGIAAVDIRTGEKRWLTPKAAEATCTWTPAKTIGASALFSNNPCMNAQPGAIALIPGVVFSGSLDGHMRAYNTAEGTVVWDFNTGVTYDAVNGGKATGGSINYSAEAVADGIVYVNSGSGGNNQPGNALIAFSVDGK